MKRNDPTVDWPRYFQLVQQKQAKKAQRKDLYGLIVFMAFVVAALLIFGAWTS